MKRKGKLTIATAAAVLATLTATGFYAQDAHDKYTLKTSSGVAFSDFSGYLWK
jgi:DNA-binding IclR family transcriptional regulator